MHHFWKVTHKKNTDGSDGACVKVRKKQKKSGARRRQGTTPDDTPAPPGAAAARLSRSNSHCARALAAPLGSAGEQPNRPLVAAKEPRWVPI